VALIAWLLAAALIIAGVAGIILPGLPGAILILAAAIVHKLMLPGWLSWWTVTAVAVLFLVDWAVSTFASIAGAKWAGATRAGLIGASVGLVVGLFFSIPGMILGPLVGALVAEIVFAKRHAADATRAALGTGAGLLAGTAARFFIAVLMVSALIIDWFFVT
jgi:hypothetical protein